MLIENIDVKRNRIELSLSLLEFNTQVEEGLLEHIEEKHFELLVTNNYSYKIAQVRGFNGLIIVSTEGYFDPQLLLF